MTDRSRSDAQRARVQPTAEDHPAPGRHRVRADFLWFGVLAAPLAWTAQVVLATPINGFSCLTARDAAPPGGVQMASSTWSILFSLSAVLLVIGLVGLYVSWRNWNSVHTHTRGEEDDLLEVGEGRTRFVAMSGILLGGVFSLLLVLNTMTLFVVAQCIP